MKMPLQSTTLTTIGSLANGSVFKCPRPLWGHNWNNNNKYGSLSQSGAPERDSYQSYVTGHSSPQIPWKRHPHLKHGTIPETTQLVSPVQETATSYFPSGIFNYFHSQGHIQNDSLRQQLPGINGQDTTMNASNRQDTPSTLSLSSFLGEERPRYSQFTLGLSPLISPSFLFPQQVTYEKHKNPHTSSHSLKYSNVRRDDFNTRIRSSESTTDKPDYFYTSTRSSTSSHDDNEDPDTSFGSITSSPDENEDHETFRRSSTSSCDEEGTGFSPTVRYHVDSSTLFGDVDSTPPLTTKDRQIENVERRPPPPTSVTARQPIAQTPSVRRDAQRKRFQKKQYYLKYNRDLQADTPRRAKPESAFLSDFYSPYRDHSNRATPTPQPSPLKDESPNSPESSYRGACRGIKPPCFKLGTEFGEEPGDSVKAQNITDKEFYHFVNDKLKVAVMFYFGDMTTPDSLKVWDRQAKEKSLWDVEAYGSVDCNIERELCAREYIASNPFFKMYVGGYATSSGPHFKVLD